ncbi:molybdenum cofactor biosynthesis protein MoaE [Pokkaliibacter sp. MBI-7]|uniref:molybdenum cofactor biosynthesis protein MoaE n=1 Tax=Pokkaliibacter sp. MBI-7 TaxID=3040600 RepID=UPI00244A6EDF|nr:molybdenum cofactor biosynthesis protein MoaE [Pokkaliibacter sp. MBI-7]MDH2436552.1 molybdenum cofactor biosynthesis protein MoaE [Pokkaliibacter sp. MBI-7]
MKQGSIPPQRARVQSSPLDLQGLLQQFQPHDGQSDEYPTGAIVSFSGLVRDFNERPEVTALTLEHYPGMTEKVLHQLLLEAQTRWQLQDALVVHRVGRMLPGDTIVFVAVASSHRKDAFAACEYIMDMLKTRAPFWKKEETGNDSYWVDARESDAEAAAAWLKDHDGH